MLSKRKNRVDNRVTEMWMKNFPKKGGRKVDKFKKEKNVSIYTDLFNSWMKRRHAIIHTWSWCCLLLHLNETRPYFCTKLEYQEELMVTFFQREEESHLSLTCTWERKEDSKKPWDLLLYCKWEPHLTSDVLKNQWVGVRSGRADAVLFLSCQMREDELRG